MAIVRYTVYEKEEMQSPQLFHCCKRYVCLVMMSNRETMPTPMQTEYFAQYMQRINHK